MAAETIGVTSERTAFDKELEADGLRLQHFEKGFMVYGTNILDAPESHILIADLYVHRSHRKNGVARDMVDRLAEAGRENGVCALYAGVATDAKDYKRTLEVVRRLGFKLHGADERKLLLFRRAL